MGKTKSQRQRMEKHFKMASRERAYSSYVREPRGGSTGFSYEAEKRFNSNVKVGSRILCRLAQPDDEGRRSASFIPSIVQAVWRDDAGNVKKLEVFGLTQKINKIYPSDYYITDDGLRAMFRERSSENGRMSTEKIYVIDNNSDCVHKGTIPISIDERLWPEILARRVQGLLYSTGSKVCGEIDTTLTREGFFFPLLPHHAMRSGNFAPEIGVADFKTKRALPMLLSQATVDRITLFAVSYTEHMRAQGNPFFIFPPVKEWSLDLPRPKFPVWNEGPAPRLAAE